MYTLEKFLDTGTIEVSYEGFDFCDCDHLDIKVNNLKQGIRQWNIFPKSISIDSEVELSDVVNTFPEILMDALSIKCYFDWNAIWTRKTYYGYFRGSKSGLTTSIFSFIISIQNTSYCHTH